MDQFRYVPWFLLGIGILWSSHMLSPAPAPEIIPVIPIPAPSPIEPMPDEPPTPSEPPDPSPDDTFIFPPDKESEAVESVRSQRRFRLFRRLRGCR